MRLLRLHALYDLRVDPLLHTTGLHGYRLPLFTHYRFTFTRSFVCVVRTFRAFALFPPRFSVPYTLPPHVWIGLIVRLRLRLVAVAARIAFHTLRCLPPFFTRVAHCVSHITVTTLHVIYGHRLRLDYVLIVVPVARLRLLIVPFVLRLFTLVGYVLLRAVVVYTPPAIPRLRLLVALRVLVYALLFCDLRLRSHHALRVDLVTVTFAVTLFRLLLPVDSRLPFTDYTHARYVTFVTFTLCSCCVFADSHILRSGYAFHVDSLRLPFTATHALFCYRRYVAFDYSVAFVTFALIWLLRFVRSLRLRCYVYAALLRLRVCALDVWLLRALDYVTVYTFYWTLHCTRFYDFAIADLLPHTFPTLFGRLRCVCVAVYILPLRSRCYHVALFVWCLFTRFALVLILVVGYAILPLIYVCDYHVLRFLIVTAFRLRYVYLRLRVASLPFTLFTLLRSVAFRCWTRLLRLVTYALDCVYVCSFTPFVWIRDFTVCRTTHCRSVYAVTRVRCLRLRVTVICFTRFTCCGLPILPVCLGCAGYVTLPVPGRLLVCVTAFLDYVGWIRTRLPLCVYGCLRLRLRFVPVYACVLRLPTFVPFYYGC